MRRRELSLCYPGTDEKDENSNKSKATACSADGSAKKKKGIIQLHQTSTQFHDALHRVGNSKARLGHDLS